MRSHTIEQSAVSVDSMRAWEELQGYDPALDERIAQIQSGAALNGHHPNGLLTDALASKPGGEKAFIEEYTWLLALEAYPFRDQEPRATLMLAGIDALFNAGEKYDATKEPNFLIHTSGIIANYLEENFGAPKHTRPIPVEALVPFLPPEETTETVQEETAEEIPIQEAEVLLPSPADPEENLVIDELDEGEEAEEDLAGLEDSPVPEFAEEAIDLGQIPDDEEPEAEIEIEPEADETSKATPAKPKQGRKGKKYKAQATPEVTIPPRTTPCLPNERTAEDLVRSQRVLFLVGDQLHDATVKRVTPHESPSIKKPGFVWLVTPEDPVGFIVDMDVNRIIPLPDWQKIKDDPDYRHAWHDSGTPEDQREAAALAKAIHQRRRESFTEATADTTPGKRRAKPRSAMTRAMGRYTLTNSD